MRPGDDGWSPLMDRAVVARRVALRARRSPTAQSRGFTLIEVLLAMLIVGVAFVALSQGMGSAAQSSSTTQKRTRAIMLASQKMVEVETGAIDVTRQNADGVFPEPDDDFSFEVTAMQFSTGGAYDVTLTVKWGDDSSVVLHRLIHPALRAGK